MQAALPRALRILVLLVPTLMFASASQAIVEDTGSTNRPGMRVTLDRNGQAVVEPRQGETQRIHLPQHMCQRLMHDLDAAGPLDELPTIHCVKSVSFGSRMFVEFKGHRSPDLSCPATQDSRSLALQKAANEILQAARDVAGIPAGRIFTVPAPRTPK